MRIVLGAPSPCGTSSSEQWPDRQARAKRAAIDLNTMPPHPMTSFVDSCSQLTITADARLDDRATLISRLGPGHATRACTDTELILRSYQKWGKCCPEYLLGDFTFVVQDPQRQQVFCARDRLGVKPFYYAMTANGVVFGSDIETVLDSPDVDQSFDEATIAAHLTFRSHFDASSTFYSGIKKLPVAHHLTVCPNSVSLQKYWHPENAPAISLSSDGEYDEAFLDLLSKAVYDRLPADQSTGAHVSGGLDSSSIAVLAARRLAGNGRSLAAFCWAPPPDGSQTPTGDERDLIQLVCKQEGLTNSWHNIEPEDFIRFLKHDVTCQPATSTLVHEFKVQKQAQERGVNVLLSGWGGDELISNHGQSYLPGLVRAKRWRSLLQESRSRGWKCVATAGVLPVAPAWSRQMIGWMRPDLVQSAPTSFSFANRQFARRTLPDGNPQMHPKQIRQHQLQLLNHGHLTERIESWALHGARRGVEYRYPLLDSRLIEFSLGLPAEQYIRGNQTRVLLRRALTGLLPQEVLQNRDKRDPARSKNLKTTKRKALNTIGQQLASEPWPTRSSFVDMPHLIDRLTTKGQMKPGELCVLSRVLQFLDF